MRQVHATLVLNSLEAWEKTGTVCVCHQNGARGSPHTDHHHEFDFRYFRSIKKSEDRINGKWKNRALKSRMYFDPLVCFNSTKHLIQWCISIRWCVSIVIVLKVPKYLRSEACSNGYFCIYPVLGWCYEICATCNQRVLLSLNYVYLFLMEMCTVYSKFTQFTK